MTPLRILNCWLQVWCLKCFVAFPVASGGINCSGLAPPLNFAKGAAILITTLLR